MDAYDGKSTASMILGIISVGLAWFGYSTIVGLVCGIIALVMAVNIKKAAETEGFEPNTKTRAGFVLGIVGIIINLLAFIACVACVGLMSAINFINSSGL